jgi:FkbM family methyltransferase
MSLAAILQTLRQRFVSPTALKRERGAESSGGEWLEIRGVPLCFQVIEGDSGDQLRSGYESEVYEFIDSLPPGSTLYDLGASIGHFSLYAAAKGLRTLAFEPDPTNFRALTTNASANNLDNLSAFEIAISDGVEATSVLRTSSQKPRIGDHHKVLDVADYSGARSLLNELDRVVTVRSMALDAAIDRLDLPQPTALKVDIDGSELAFLRGAACTLRDGRLQSVLIELWRQSTHYPTIVTALEAAGLRATTEHQIFSGIGIEEGLFNIRFDRSVTGTN